MAETLSNNEIALRSCILYEALRGETAEKTYKKLQEVINNLDYEFFNYWFLRFSNGKFDLYHDGPDSKPRGLLAMPNEVLEIIMKDMSLLDRLNTRKVSQRLRSVIDQQKTHCDKLTISAKRDSKYEIHLKDQKMIYASRGSNLATLVVNRPDPSVRWTHRSEITKELYVTGGQLEMLRKDLSVILNPNWTLEELEIDFDWDHRQDDRRVDNANRLDFIKSVLSTSKVCVKQFTLRSFGLAPMIALLPCLDPDVLEKITFNCDQMERHMIHAVMITAYWKNAKSLCFNKLPDWFAIEDLFHAPDFTVKYCEITRELLVKIRDVLFTNPIFESCSLSFESQNYREQRRWFCDKFGESDEDSEDDEVYDLDDLIKLVEEVMSVHRDNYNSNNWHYRVEGTNKYFKIKCRQNELVCLIIERKIALD